MVDTRTTSDIIDLFGGTGVVADLLGANQSAVSMWRARGGIPGKWHLPLLRLARERGVELSDEELLSTTNTGRTAIRSCCCGWPLPVPARLSPSRS
jgi:hypothetical protein